jgi:uncharacterized membrane protein
MTIGPVQVLVIGFDGPHFTGAIRDELDRLRDNDVVRLVDLVAVRKHEDGTIERLQHSDLSAEEAAELGAVVGALIGLGAAGEEGAEMGAYLGAAAAEDGGVLEGDDSWYVDEAIPPGSAAAIVLLEHRWAIPLRDAIGDAGGFHLADAWIHPVDLVAAGLLMPDELPA